MSATCSFNENTLCAFFTLQTNPQRAIKRVRILYNHKPHFRKYQWKFISEKYIAVFTWKNDDKKAFRHPFILDSFHHIHLLPGFQRSQALSSALVIIGFQILLIHSHHPKLEGRVLRLDQCGGAVAQQRQHMLLRLVWHYLTSKTVLAFCAHTAAWNLCWQWTLRL